MVDNIEAIFKMLTNADEKEVNDAVYVNVCLK